MNTTKARETAAIAAALMALPASACVPELAGAARTLDTGRYTLAYRSVPPKIAVGEHFSLEVAVCANGGTPLPDSLSVDAQMPEHRHGMNYKPGIKRVSATRFRADGLMFHMPGRWEFDFELRAAGRTDRVKQSEVFE
ncbi:MAG: hypothetical protein JWN94_1645 [Betaproteobacteria bacterium]|nr:hypothetical protein [Betaproteobacteria bacterium]